MKRLAYLLPVLLLSLYFISCEEFLNTKPEDGLTTAYYYSTEAQLNTALIGVYDPLGTEALYGNNLFANLGNCADEGFFARSGQATGPMVYNYDPSAVEIRDFWSASYQGIERANLLIANIGKPQMDETKRKQILGQALFLRGYYYFLLASNFGDVPLKIVPTPSVIDVSAVGTPLQDVYAQIIKDMTDAEGMVSTATELGTGSRVSKTTVQGILARVCLTMAGYPLNDAARYSEALSWAQKVQQSNEHALNEAYSASAKTAFSQIFINHAQDIYNVKESMWEAEFSGNRTDSYVETGRLGNTMGIAFAPSTNFADTGYCYGFINVTAKLFNLYGTGDLRRDWAIAPYSYNYTTFARVPFTATQIYNRNAGKWRRSYEILRPKNKNFTPINFPILRYADVLLMLAEAENEVNGPTSIAYDAINMVRRRGYGLPVSISSIAADLPSGLTKEEFKQAIQDERSRELCFEGLRRSDLIRWGIFVSTMNALGAEISSTGGTYAYAGVVANRVGSRHTLFPIPSDEISVNKRIVQNPGW